MTPTRPIGERPLDLVGTGEAGEILGCTSQTVRYQVTAGNLEPLGTVGRRMVFLRSEVEELAEKRRSN